MHHALILSGPPGSILERRIGAWVGSGVARLALLAIGDRELGLEAGVLLAQPLVLGAQVSMRCRSDASVARWRAGTASVRAGARSVKSREVV
jgi:hypothetical protein